MGVGEGKGKKESSGAAGSGVTASEEEAVVMSGMSGEEGMAGPRAGEESGVKSGEKKMSGDGEEAAEKEKLREVKDGKEAAAVADKKKPGVEAGEEAVVNKEKAGVKDAEEEAAAVANKKKAEKEKAGVKDAEEEAAAVADKKKPGVEAGEEAVAEKEKAGAEEEAAVTKKEEPGMCRDIIAVVVACLPTKEAYKCALLAKPVSEDIKSPLFLMKHMAPRAPSTDDVPAGFLLQPANNREGYSHLSLFELCGGGGRSVYSLAVRPDNDPTKDYKLPQPWGYEHFTLAQDEKPAPPFFDETVRELDLHFVASHGRLLLARNCNAFFVCSPDENGWVTLPFPDNFSSSLHTAAGLRYAVNPASGLDFTAILIVPKGSGEVAVVTFSSADGAWKTVTCHNEAAASLINEDKGVARGIYVGGAYWWIKRDNGLCVRKSGMSDSGKSIWDSSTVLCYQPLEVGGHLSVVAAPPKAEGYTRRVGASLGWCGGGRIRLSTVDVATEEPYGFVAAPVATSLSIWDKKGGEPGWTLVNMKMISHVSWQYLNYCGFCIPLDYGGSRWDRVVLRQDRRKLFYLDIETGEKIFLSDLYHGICDPTHSMYQICDVFALFM